MTKVLVTLLASSALCASLPLRAQAELDVVSLKSAIERSVESDYPKLDALYKDIHAHPEIAFQEEKTAAKLAAEMRALGFEVTEHVGKTGLVAIYKNGDGPTIWCAPNSMRCRWKKRPAFPTPATTRRFGKDAKLSWLTVAATTFTWRAGLVRQRRWLA